MTKEVSRRWYGVGRGDAGKREEKSTVRRSSVGVRAGGKGRVWVASTSLAGATKGLARDEQDFDRILKLYQGAVRSNQLEDLQGRG